MLKTTKKLGRAIVGALVCTALVCCVQFEQKTILYPDGSGKVEMVIAVKEEMAKLMEGGAEDPFADFEDPLLLEETTDGFVAWGESSKEVVDGWLELRITGYFDDITEAKYYDVRGDESLGVPDKLSLGFEFKEEDGLRTLTFHNDIEGNIPESFTSGDRAQSTTDKVKEMFSGLRIEMSVGVPGEIVAITNLAQDERTATFVLDEDTLFGVQGESETETKDRLAFLKASEGRHVSWRETSVSEEQVADFKQELEAAKLAWEKKLAEAKVK